MVRDILFKFGSRMGKEPEEIVIKVIEVFNRLYKTSKDFRNAIDGPLPIADPFKDSEIYVYSILESRYPLDKILFDWERRKIFNKKGSPNLLKEFNLLVNLCKKLNSEYETYVFLCKYRDEKNPENMDYSLYISYVENFTIPRGRVSQYKVKGNLIERVVANREKDACIRESTRLTYDRFDEIQIDDLNSPSSKCGNVLTDDFARISRITPTVVKYTNHEGSKRLFVSLLESLDVTTFLKEYGKMLSEIHRDFYGKTYKGRPKEMSHQLALMEEIWREKCEGKKLSANQQSKKLSDELKERHDINLEPITITRWYLPRLKEKMRQKMTNN